MRSLGRMIGTLTLGFCVAGYSAGLVADEGGESKFADPDRLYETMMADDEAAFADDLAALDENYTPDNIDDVLNGLNDDLDAVEELLDAVVEAETTLEGTLDEIPDAISDVSDAADAGDALTAVQGLLELGNTELADAIAALDPPPSIEVTREVLEGWESDLETQIDAFDTALTNAEGQQDEYDRLSSEITAIEEVVNPFNEKKEAMVSAIENLSPEQIFALNRSLNNALNNGLIERMQEYDLDIVEMAAEMSKQQINALTKAFEEEAKFTKLAEKFADGSKQSEHMLRKADAHKARFLAKAGIDLGDTATAAAKGAAKNAAKDAAKDAVKNAAKGAAKNAAKQAAKSAAKDAAKNAAKQAAKSAAKDAAKNAAKQAAKNAAKQAAKQAAKNAAKKGGRA